MGTEINGCDYGSSKDSGLFLTLCDSPIIEVQKNRLCVMRNVSVDSFLCFGNQHDFDGWKLGSRKIVQWEK